MNGGPIGLWLIFGVVLSPVYLMLIGWAFGRPRELRLPMIGLGFIAGFTALAWGGMAAFAYAVDVLYFP
jgi:hypothetical protein